MGKIIGLLALTLLVSCGNDKTKVINNSARVSDLERRMALNEQLDSLQNQRLDALEAAVAAEEAARIAADEQLQADLQAEMDARIAGDAALAQLVANERAARIAGDLSLSNRLQFEIANRIAGDVANSAALAFASFSQSLVNFGVQQNLNQINGRFSVVNSRLSSLESRMSSAESDINSLESDMADLQSDISALSAQLNARIDSVAASAAATQAQLDVEGVKIFKCNSASSTERILKINGRFYAAMNRVTTRQAQVITGSSSQTISIPKLCKNPGDEIKLPQSNGNCKNNETVVSGTGVSTTFPSYSTANITVVDSVKIAIDILADGSYSTTDGGPACSFSISGGGSSQSGLIQVAN